MGVLEPGGHPDLALKAREGPRLLDDVLDLLGSLESRSLVLVEEAGGRVTDFFGGRTFLQSGHIIVTNGLLHDWMLEGIASVFPRDGDYSKRS
jgi:hypothetical protein